MLSAGACRVPKLQEIQDQLLNPLNHFFFFFAESLHGLTNPSALCPPDTPTELFPVSVFLLDAFRLTTRNCETAAKEANVTEWLYEITKLQSPLICVRIRGAHSTNETVEKCPQNIGAK